MNLPSHTGYVAMLLLCCALLPSRLIPAPRPVPHAIPQSLVSDFRATVDKIQCASNQEEAAYHLHQLRKHQLITPGIPVESTTGNSQELRATSLDKALLVLADSAKKFPKNKDLVEKTVIQWNFCSVIDNETFYDHRSANGKTERYPSTAEDSNLWSGFHAFGLTPGPDQSNLPEFDFTTPYTSTAIRSLADRRLQQRYINHCLPHPDDGHLYRDFGRNFISRLSPASAVKSPLIEWTWRIQCQTEEPLLTEIPSTREAEQNPIAANTNQTELVNSLIEAEPITAQKDEAKTQFPVLAAAIELPAEKPLPGATQNRFETRLPDSVIVPIPAREIEIVLANSIEPDTSLTPVAVTGRRAGNDVVTPTTSNSKGFSGSISLNNRSFTVKNTSINFAASYKPVKDSYWFIRSGLNISQESKPLTYTWGLGYDDWHAGTWAVQLNHWGPLKPGDGLDFKNAVADVSYKFNKPWLDHYDLSSSISLSKPISKKPTLSWGWSWSPYSHWFIRSTLMKPLGENGLNWSYGFGYTRYANKSLSLEYNNWGPNELPDHNFKKNGLVSLIYRWSF